MEVNGAPKQPGYKLSSKYLPLCSAEQRLIQVWNYLRVSKWWQNFHFWVNYPFKLIMTLKTVLSCSSFIQFNNIMNSCCLVIGMNYSSQNCRIYWFIIHMISGYNILITYKKHFSSPIVYLQKTIKQTKKSLFCDCTNHKFAARTTFVQNQKLQQTHANTYTHTGQMDWDQRELWDSNLFLTLAPTYTRLVYCLLMYLQSYRAANCKEVHSQRVHYKVQWFRDIKLMNRRIKSR